MNSPPANQAGLLADMGTNFDSCGPNDKPVCPEKELSTSRGDAAPPTTHEVIAKTMQRRGIASWIINISLGGVTLAMFLAIGRFAAIIPWAVAFGFLVLAGSWWDRRSRQRGHLLRLLVTSYLAISLVGMLEISDNIRNFGTMFGGGADDSEYFFNTRTILKDGMVPDNAGLYEVVLSAWGYLPNLVWKETTSAFEFLPLNWALAALIVGLCGELCHIVMNVRPPLWLMVVTLLGNYKFTDSVIHLYRDGLMLIFLLLALNSILAARHLRSFLYALPMVVLRGANFVLYFPVLMLSLSLRRLRTRALFYGWVSCILCATVWILSSVGPQVFRYASRITYSAGDESIVTRTIGEQMDFRGQVIAAAVGPGAQETTLGAAMTNDSAASMVIRPIAFELVPTRFWPLEMGGDSRSRFAVNWTVYRGLTLRNIYEWFSIACWVVVIPLLIVGLGNAALGSRMLNILFIYYAVCVFAVSFISFEMRHAAAFIVLHPLLAMLGYKACKKHKIAQLAAIGVGVITAVGLCAYNSFGGPLL